MWTIGRMVDGWKCETGPCGSKATAMAYGRAITDGTRWTVKQSPDGKWWVLIK